MFYYHIKSNNGFSLDLPLLSNSWSKNFIANVVCIFYGRTGVLFITWRRKACYHDFQGLFYKLNQNVCFTIITVFYVFQIDRLKLKFDKKGIHKGCRDLFISSSSSKIRNCFWSWESDQFSKDFTRIAIEILWISVKNIFQLEQMLF
jgi:hypothetical protein